MKSSAACRSTSFPAWAGNRSEVSNNPILSALLRVVLRACEREPEKRFADARRMLDELESPARGARRFRRRPILAAAAVGVLATAGLCAWIFLPRAEEETLVDVNFVTYPFEAKIYLDDQLQSNSAGKPYTTPCTLEGLPARTHRVAFQWGDGPRSDAGSYDFARTRQIRWPE